MRIRWGNIFIFTLLIVAVVLLIKSHAEILASLVSMKNFLFSMKDIGPHRTEAENIMRFICLALIALLVGLMIGQLFVRMVTPNKERKEP